jgi:Ferritin-like domain
MDTKELAAPELAGVEVHGLSRGAFIMRGALAAGAVYGLGTVGPFVRTALAKSGSGDIEILNFALTLEYLESTFYKEAQQKVKLSGDVKSLAKLIGGDEDQHVAALMTAIKGSGGKPVAAPTVVFPFSDEAGFLKLAQTFEDTGVSAYNGAAPAIKSKDVLAAAGSIVQIEARHAAAIRLLNRKPISDGGFDKALDMQAVLDAVKPFVKS